MPRFGITVSRSGAEARHRDVLNVVERVRSYGASVGCAVIGSNGAIAFNFSRNSWVISLASRFVAIALGVIRISSSVLLSESVV